MTFPQHGYSWNILPNRAVRVLADTLPEARAALEIAYRTQPDVIVDVPFQQEFCSACGQRLNGEECSGCEQPWFLCDCEDE